MGHDVCSVQDELDRLTTEINAKLNQNMPNEKEIISANQKLQSTIEKATRSERENIDIIHQEESQLIDEIHKTYSALRDEIHQAVHDKIKSCEAKISKNNAIGSLQREKTQELDALGLIPLSDGVDAARLLLNEVDTKLLDVSTVGEDQEVHIKFERNPDISADAVEYGRLLLGSDDNKAISKQDGSILRSLDLQKLVLREKVCAGVNTQAAAEKNPSTASNKVEPNLTVRSGYDVAQEKRLVIRDRVTRGPDYGQVKGYPRPNPQDGGIGGTGTVTNVEQLSKFKNLITVEWDGQKGRGIRYSMCYFVKYGGLFVGKCELQRLTIQHY